jgi:hypothetical protein
MGRSQLGYVVITGLGLALVAESVVYAGAYLSLLLTSTGVEFRNAAQASIPTGVTAIAGATVIAFRNQLSRLLFDGNRGSTQPEQPQPAALSAGTLQSALGYTMLTVVGLYFILRSVAYSATAFALLLWPEDPITHGIAQAAISFAAVAVAGGLVLAFRDRLTAALFTDAAEPQASEASRIVAALLAILGVYLAVTALIETAATELEQFSRSTIARNEFLTLMLDPRVPRSLIQIRIVNAARFLIGLALFFRSEGVARFWNDFRAAGRGPATASHPEDPQ